MNTILSKSIGFGFLFLLVVLTGFRLTRAGMPYPVIVFTLHKLIALAGVILFITTVVRIHQAAPLQAEQWLAVAITALCLVATIITGGLVSVDKTMPAFIHKTHQILPGLTILFVAISLYLLLFRNPLISTT